MMNYTAMMKGGLNLKSLLRQRLVGSNYNDARSMPALLLRMQSHRHVTNDWSIHVSNEVSQALRNNQPVVALESTIITHGMPWPVNLETACKVETVIRLLVIYIYANPINLSQLYTIKLTCFACCLIRVPSRLRWASSKERYMWA